MPAKTGKPAPAGFMWVEDAAEALGLEVCTLYKWRQRCVGPTSGRHAGRLIYSKAGIEGYLASLLAPEAPAPRVPRPHVRRAA